ncbi:MAG: hypothetical protein Q7U64_10515 [Desulfocapsaceae bacterium]|jgi:hypothetical protein|nr:hypothetical protein [Desulfocapsaceae bacterium]
MMKTRRIMVWGLAVMCAMTLTGEAMARGGNGGGARVQSQATRQITTQTTTQTTTRTTTARPADSQRRDGTFLTTGTTANGSTTRPANGNGLHDGSGLGRTTTNP